MWGTSSLEKTLMLRRIEGRRRRGWQKMRWLDSITNPKDIHLSKLWETVKDRESWHTAVHRITKSQTQLSSWTTTGTMINKTGILLCSLYFRVSWMHTKGEINAHIIISEDGKPAFQRTEQWIPPSFQERLPSTVEKGKACQGGEAKRKRE